MKIKCPLTPKGLDCCFWHYRFSGKVPVSGDLVYFGPNFNRRCGQGVSFSVSNFKTFGNQVKSY